MSYGAQGRIDTIMDIQIGREKTGDHQAIKLINDLAFGQPGEGMMVEALRENSRFVPELSLVAVDGGAVVGHILFFPVDIITPHGRVASLSLAPLAVHPDLQGKGIGSRLVTAGVRAAEVSGFASIIVMGHPSYYPRFGFSPASRWGIRPPMEAPDEAFMALELVEGCLEGKAGVVEYPREYDVAL
jgi:putative acetyltransferase